MILRIIKRAWLRIILTWIVAALLLWWVFHGVDFKAMGKDVWNIKWGWVILGAAADVLCYSSQGFRWSLLLQPFGRIHWVRTTQAIYGGVFFNQILPFRMGELVRSYLVSRRISTSIPNVLATVVVERVMDGFYLAGAFFIVTLNTPLPASLKRAGDILGALILGAVVLLLIFARLKFARGQSNGSRIVRHLREFPETLRRIGSPGLLFYSFVASGPMLLFKAIAFWFVMIGYGVSASIWVATAVVIIEHVGTVIPNAPSNVGAYQFFATLGLMLFGVDKTQAAGIAMLAFLMFTLPFFVLGPMALALSGINLGELRAWVQGKRGKLRLADLSKK